jgi:WD domain, G-beta repeat
VDLVLEEHTVSVNALLAASNGVLYSGAGDKTVRRWHLTTGALIGTAELSPVVGAEGEFVYATVRSFTEFSPVGVLAACGDRVIRLFSYECQVLSTFLGHSSFIFTVKSLSLVSILSLYSQFVSACGSACVSV